MKTPFRIGTKVYLRALTREDAPQLAQWINDPEVTRTLLMYRPVSLHAEEAWVASLGTSTDEVVLGIALKHSDALTLNLNRVWLHVNENNERGLRAYEKVGFRREGVLRQETYREGRYFDAVIMAILRGDWAQRCQTSVS